MITELSPFFAHIFNYLIQEQPSYQTFTGKTLFIHIDPLYINLRVNEKGQWESCQSISNPDLKICSTVPLHHLIQESKKHSQPKHYFLEQLHMTGNIGLAKSLSESIENNPLSIESLFYYVFGKHTGSWLYQLVQHLVHYGKLSFRELQELAVQHALYTNPTLVSQSMFLDFKHTVEQEFKRLEILENKLNKGTNV